MRQLWEDAPSSFMTNFKFVRIDIIVQRLEVMAETLQLDSDLLQWFENHLIPEAYAESVDADTPCQHPPGTPQKIAALRKRWAKRLNLWNPDDRGFV